MKRFIALIMAIIMCFGFISFSAAAVTYRDDFPNTHKNTGKNLADLIAVAKTQIGYTELSTSTGKPLGTTQDGGYTKYGAWFGAPTIAWCAYFVSWCSNQAGISTSVIPRMGNCEAITNWYKNKGRYLYASEAAPRVGDLIMYNWAGGRVAEHIGIITGVSGNYIYTIEGNTGSSYGYRCEAKTRTRGARYIIGYARPAYNDATTYVGSYSFAEYAAQKYKAYQKGGSSTGNGSYSGTSKLAVVTSKAENIAAKTATLKGRIENNTSYNITYAGFYFGKSKNNLAMYGEYYNSSKQSLSISMDISKRFGSLEPATTYYYCAYASINGVAYKGPVFSLTTVDDRPQMIALSETEACIEVGETYEILAAVLPLEASDAEIKWSSDNKSAVTVKDGMLTGKGTGNAVITAKSDYGKVSATCSVTVALAPVSGVKANVISYKEIGVSWNPENNFDVLKYEIYRSESPSKGFEKIGETYFGDNTFVDKKADIGTYYYYKVKSIGLFEEYNSDLSKGSSIKAVPATPKIKSISQNGIPFTISWSEVDGAEKYNVYRSYLPERGYSLVGTVSGTQFKDTDICYGKKYYYKVAAVRDSVLSGFSDCEYKIAGDINTNTGYDFSCKSGFMINKWDCFI